jgi:hypothetical protein
VAGNALDGEFFGTLPVGQRPARRRLRGAARLDPQPDLRAGPLSGTASPLGPGTPGSSVRSRRSSRGGRAGAAGPRGPSGGACRPQAAAARPAGRRRSTRPWAIDVRSLISKPGNGRPESDRPGRPRAASATRGRPILAIGPRPAPRRPWSAACPPVRARGPAPRGGPRRPGRRSRGPAVLRNRRFGTTLLPTACRIVYNRSSRGAARRRRDEAGGDIRGAGSSDRPPEGDPPDARPSLGVSRDLDRTLHHRPARHALAGSTAGRCGASATRTAGGPEPGPTLAGEGPSTPRGGRDARGRPSEERASEPVHPIPEESARNARVGGAAV